jgi:hypothetical protein
MKKAVQLIENRTKEILLIRSKNPTACEQELKSLDKIKRKLLDEYLKDGTASKEAVKQYISEQSIKGIFSILIFKIKRNIKNKFSRMS